jgi:nucleotide-binding universal stress UspA family protein
MKRILVGLDGSPRERQVLDAALTLATQLGGKLILFHAVAVPMTLPPHALVITHDEIAVVLARQSEQHLQKLAHEAPRGVVERTVVDVGVPWRVLCERARAESAELIIIGSHGYSGFDRLVGTTAGKIVNHAPCSVLVQRLPL